MGWSYNFWVNNFYPKGLKPNQFLAEYSKHFSAVEVDSTFYGIPSEKTLTVWNEETPTEFLFSLKFPKTVTHDKMLKDCENTVEFFLKRISLMKGKIGALLLQLPPTFNQQHLTFLEDFLPILPKHYRFALEIRNKKLLEDKLYSLLRNHNVALTTVDHPFWPKTEILTADFAYIRWEGDRRKVKGTIGQVEVDKKANIEEWANKIKKLLDNQIEVFGYYSKYYSGHPPTDAKQLLDILNFITP
jgi:uncharacterized protein YecE (DUF72 family)